jgi:membrane protein
MQDRSIVGLLKTTLREWQEDKASRLAAALAYYTAFSIAPLLLVAIAIAGLVFGDEAAQGSLFNQLQGLLGPEGASVIETAVKNSRQPGASALSAVVGLATLVWSASNVFAQLQDALNTIWEVQPKPAGVVGAVKRRILPLSMVLGIGFILLVSLVLSALLAALGRYFSGLLPGGDVIWQVVNFLVSFSLITLLFAAIYKVLPDAEIAWSDVWVGAAVTALLFTVGKLLIGLYLGNASVGSTYGAAGSLLVLLVWVYYSAQILFLGAEFTQVYARAYGSRIVASEHAVPLTEEARATQGLPRREAVEEAARTGEPVAAIAARQEPAESQPDGSRQPAPVGPRQAWAGAAGGGPTSPADSDQPPSVALAGQPPAPGRPAEPESGLLKNLLWLGLASGSLAVAGLLARRTSAAIWQLVWHEPPPSSKT